MNKIEQEIFSLEVIVYRAIYGKRSYLKIIEE